MATVVLSNIANASGLDPTQTYYWRTFLLRAKYTDFHGRFADTIDLAQKTGRNVIVRRYTHLALATSALVEGVPPTGKVPSIQDFNATLQQFGDFIAMSDFLQMTAIDKVQTEWANLLGEQAGYTTDTLNRDTANAGTTLIVTNGTARTDVNTIVDGNDLDRAIRTLDANGAMKPLDGNMGSTTIGSYPILPAYAAVTHPKVLFSIQNISGFRWANEYRGAADGEYGRYKSMAFFSAPDPASLGAGSRVFNSGGAASTAVENTAGTANVYQVVVYGRHYMHVVGLNGQSTAFYRKPLGSAGTSDPIEQISTMGWKSSSARVRTNENWGLRIETAVEN
jgi:N4-gp56 family major capsid protein